MRFALPPVLLALAACSSGTPSTTPTGDAGPATDVATTDTPVVNDAGSDAGTTDAGADAGPTHRCGSDRPDLSDISGSEGLVIAADGTIYFSQARAVGRMQPGMPAETGWVALPSAASTVWGIALDVPNHLLYVGSPASHAIYSIDYTADTPAATVYVASAGGPNGLTMGPDGALYFSDFSGNQVYRVLGGTKTRVTTAAIAQANGVAFATDGSLYVDSYGGGSVIRLVLADGVETARSTFTTGVGSPDGIAFDATGRLYVSDNAGGRLFRINADGTGRTTLATNIPQAANIEFGAGSLSCSDIYVSSGATLFRYEMGDTAGATVSWH